MITKTQANSRIDWHSGGENKHNEEETTLEARKHYFNMLRRFLKKVENAAAQDDCKRIRSLFRKFNIHFIDVDDIERVNIDEPRD